MSDRPRWTEAALHWGGIPSWLAMQSPGRRTGDDDAAQDNILTAETDVLAFVAQCTLHILFVSARCTRASVNCTYLFQYTGTRWNGRS